MHTFMMAWRSSLKAACGCEAAETVLSSLLLGVTHAHSLCVCRPDTALGQGGQNPYCLATAGGLPAEAALALEHVQDAAELRHFILYDEDCIADPVRLAPCSKHASYYCPASLTLDECRRTLRAPGCRGAWSRPQGGTLCNSIPSDLLIIAAQACTATH